jgi:hypothetical protein
VRSILISDKKDREADYFIAKDIKEERNLTTLWKLKDLIFELYAPTIFLLLVNCQMNGGWEKLAKDILYGSPPEKGLCDSFADCTFLFAEINEAEDVAHFLFPEQEDKNQVFLIVYSTEKLGSEKSAYLSLRKLLDKLARFTYGSSPHLSEESAGSYSFDPRNLKSEIEGKYLIPCYPLEEFTYGRGVAEIVEKIIESQSFAPFSSKNIKQVLVFDVVASEDIEGRKIKMREGDMKSGIDIALGKETDKIFKLLQSNSTEPPLIFLVSDSILNKTNEGEIK